MALHNCESVNFLSPGAFALRFFKEVCGDEPILVVGIDQNLPRQKVITMNFRYVAIQSLVRAQLEVLKAES